MIYNCYAIARQTKEEDIYFLKMLLQVTIHAHAAMLIFHTDEYDLDSLAFVHPV